MLQGKYTDQKTASTGYFQWMFQPQKTEEPFFLRCSLSQYRPVNLHKRQDNPNPILKCLNHSVFFLDLTYYLSSQLTAVSSGCSVLNFLWDGSPGRRDMQCSKDRAISSIVHLSSWSACSSSVNGPCLVRVSSCMLAQVESSTVQKKRDFRRSARSNLTICNVLLYVLLYVAFYIILLSLKRQFVEIQHSFTSS